MNERPAKGTKGFFLYDPITQKYFFRIYDPSDKRKFVDYKLCFEDLEVEIVDQFTSFYEGEEGERNRLDYSSQVLGRSSPGCD